jgi:hypothetical protein
MRGRGGVPAKTHDYVHRYRDYWSDRGRCRIRIDREPVNPLGEMRSWVKTDHFVMP